MSLTRPAAGGESCEAGFFLVPYEIPLESLVIQKSPGGILSCINLEYIFSIYRLANLLKVGNYIN